MGKILVSGANGFAASKLIEYILQQGDAEIHGTIRIRSDLHRLEMLGIKDKIKLHLIELTDSHSVDNVIHKVMPDQIYHLAAQDYVKSSWDAPHETYNTNVGGTINLFEAVRKCYDKEYVEHYETSCGAMATIVKMELPKIHVTSTSEIYGYHEDEIDENTTPQPRNPYAISKFTQDMIARNYNRAYQIPVVVTRAFNVTGWGRNRVFVDSNFARQIVEIEKDKRIPIIEHGLLSTKRTFIDVHDIVRGYYLAMNSDYNNGDVFCLGSIDKISRSMQEVLDVLLSNSKVKEVETRLDQDRVRPIDTLDMRCDWDKAKKLLNWEPKISFKQSMQDLLDYWRAII